MWGREREAKEKCGGTYRKLKSFEVGERFVRECKEKNSDSGVPEGRERERARASLVVREGRKERSDAMEGVSVNEVRVRECGCVRER